MKALRGKFMDVKAAIATGGLESLDIRELGNDEVEIAVMNTNAVPWSQVREKISSLDVRLVNWR